MSKTKQSLLLSFMLVVAAVSGSVAEAAAPTVTSPATQVPVVSGKDWATTSFQDPIDMSQWTDLSWWTYSADAPPVNLSGVSYGLCTATANGSPVSETSSSCFKAITSSTDANFWILETGIPASADLHKNGDNFPIDANTYKTVAFRMRLNSGGFCAPTKFPQCTTSFLWNQNNLFDGIPVTQTGAIFTYEGWGIYFIDLSTIGYAANPPQTPWAGTIRDLRYNLQNMAGANVEIDWIRLVPNTLATSQISWTGFSTQVDIYLDNNQVASDGNLGVIAQQNNTVSLAKAGSGSMTFQPGALAPGTYYVEVCPAGAAPTGGSCQYSPGSYKVNDIPTLTFTSPSPEGGADFATTVLGDAWDMNKVSDIDYFNNIAGAGLVNQGLTATTINAVDEAGNPLNNVPVLSGSGSAVGDPYLYPLWFSNSIVPGRGVTNKIDANKYHIVTFEAGIPNKARDLNGGSIARIIWQVQGESINGNPRENVSDDIVLNSRAGANVMAKVTLDMKTLKLETDAGASPSTTGWVGNIESFRFDPHEFAASTPFYLRRIKLAANEQADPTTHIYPIAWNYADTFSPSTPTMALYYGVDTDPRHAVLIATVNPAAASSYAWNTATVPNGLYYIYAVVNDGQNTNATYSRWPIIVGSVSEITASPRTIFANATKSGATLTSSSPAQDVTVTAGPSVTWTATSDQPQWVKITNGSGTGNGQFSISVQNLGDAIGSNVNLTSNVTVSSAGVTTVLQVKLYVKAAGSSDPPFGAFDTPASSATPLAGSFAVTGWALDDIGIDHVEIWRDPVAGEPTATYQGGGPANGKIFIANPTFVTGARPDVEQLHSDNPFASRAGWGYLLLSWGLWNQGNGPFTLYAFAYDVDGHVVTLGAKSIVVDNAHAVKPFGGIDTPSYGQVVNSSFFNFGWALTPNSPANCVINSDGVSVGIDSGPLMPVTYGSSRPDIFAGFPNFSNGANAGGSSLVDTTTLTNGTHQIGWLVTDSCGRADGIGSRFFTVLNGGSAPAAATTMAAQSVVSVAAASTAAVPAVDWNPVRVQRGAGSWHFSYPNSEGAHIVGVGQGERIELQLSPLDGATFEGQSMLMGVRSALPLGSSLDSRTGTFYWEPIAGFLGTFDLNFVATGSSERRSTLVRVVVGPAVRMAIDAPQAWSSVQQPFLIAGWALDLAAADGSGVDAVHVWAYPTDGRPPVFLGVAASGDARTDVGAVYGKQFQDASFNLTATGLPAGTYDLVVYPHRAATNSFDGAQAIRVTVH